MHWLRAKALYDRANEEATIIAHEMDWTVRYFGFHEQRWADRAGNPHQISPGHRSYAFYQAAMYHQFREQAADSFSKILNLYKSRQSDV